MGCGAPGCEAKLGPRNKSGFCRKHFSVHSDQPDKGARISAGKRRRFQADPAALERAREVMRRVNAMSQTVEVRRQNCIRNRLWEKGQASLTMEKRQLGARRSLETRLAWCPKELWDDYRKLLYSGNFKKAEAQKIILAQHEAELRRLRARMGVTGPVEVHEPNYAPNDNATVSPYQEETNNRADKAKERKAEVDALRQRRTLCPICGARSDVGCEHGEAA